MTCLLVGPLRKITIGLSPTQQVRRTPHVKVLEGGGREPKATIEADDPAPIHAFGSQGKWLVRALSRTVCGNKAFYGMGFLGHMSSETERRRTRCALSWQNYKIPEPRK